MEHTAATAADSRTCKAVPNPIVTIKMDNDEVIKLELYPDIAPESCKNFIHLVSTGFYNGLIFHRIIDGFMIQGGDPQGTGMGGPGWHIKGEFRQNGFNNNIHHGDGVLSMARAQSPNSAGSQFFIMVADASYLDGAYAAFGKTIEGLDVVHRLGKLPTNFMDRPIEPPVMKEVTVETFGVIYDEPEKL